MTKKMSIIKVSKTAFTLHSVKMSSSLFYREITFCAYLCNMTINHGVEILFDLSCFKNVTLTRISTKSQIKVYEDQPALKKASLAYCVPAFSRVRVAGVLKYNVKH